MFHRNTTTATGTGSASTATATTTSANNGSKSIRTTMSDDSMSSTASRRSSCESVPSLHPSNMNHKKWNVVDALSPYHNDDDDDDDDDDNYSDGNAKGSKLRRGTIPRMPHMRFVFMMTLIIILVTLYHYHNVTPRRFRRHHHYRGSSRSNGNSPSSLYQLRATHSHSTPDYDQDSVECRWYLAESAIPHSGLGIFTAIPLHPDDVIGYPDICIFVSDGPSHWTHLRSHSFGRGSFFGQYEGDSNRAACEGLITTVNTVPDAQVNMEMVSPVLPTNAGLHRAVSPGAGAATHHYGIHGKALTTITAGAEITINYGDWDFDTDGGNHRDVYNYKPTRTVPWLQQYGWCIDYIEIDISTVPNAGRGAFARMALSQGTVVAPAPLQVFHHRDEFKSPPPQSEQLFVNYCLQPAGSNMLLFPYGQGVNLINHSFQHPNVELRWSTHQMHHDEYLDLATLDEFWKIVTPGSLILEVVALRNIEPGEELLLNYGAAWEDAWNAHVAHWAPPPNATQYVYPSDMDETLPVRTMREQLDDPYPDNLLTMCLTSDFEREESNHTDWSEPTDFTWAEGMVVCHVLERQHDRQMGDDSYTVSLIFDSKNLKNLQFDPTVPLKDLYIDFHVPRRAIRFMERPYHDDEHLPQAFRHPIELPLPLVPDIWKIATTDMSPPLQPSVL